MSVRAGGSIQIGRRAGAPREPGSPARTRRRFRSLRWLKWSLPILLIIAALAVGLEPAGRRTFAPETPWIQRIDERLRAHASSVQGERIIFVGGTNVLFGIDAESLEQELYTPVLAYGLHSGLGADVIADRAAAIVRRGDLVVYMPELCQFRHDFQPTAAIRSDWLSQHDSEVDDSIARFPRRALLGARKWWGQRLSGVQRSIVPTFGAMAVDGSTAPVATSSDSAAKGPYDLDAIDGRGQLDFPRPETSTSYHHCDHTECRPEDYDLEDSPAMTGLRILARACEQSGARLRVQPGVRIVDKDTSDNTKQAMAQREQDWVAVAEKMGVRPLMPAGQNVFQAEHAYDTDHHLNDQGTALLAERLLPELRKTIEERAFFGFEVIRGLSPAQGPLPRFELPVYRWGMAPLTRLSFDSDGSPANLRLECRRNAFPELTVVIRLGDEVVGTYGLGPQAQFRTIDVPLQPARGTNIIDIEYSHWSETPPNQRRGPLYKGLKIFTSSGNDESAEYQAPKYYGVQYEPYAVYRRRPEPEIPDAQRGLIAHVSCGDGRATAKLRGKYKALVHALESDPEKLNEARERIWTQRQYGDVSVMPFDGSNLPYADNLVNILVSEGLNKVPLDEVQRVLCPGGVAYLKQDYGWAKIEKPRSGETDEWTHFLHDASGNAAGSDTVVGSPHHLRWTAEPTWNPGIKTSSIVSSGGRLYYILDARTDLGTPDGRPWKLHARDAFNGVLLWKRGLDTWDGAGRKKIGPAPIARRLVAVGDLVYVTLGHDQPVSELDARTGETIREFPETRGAEEIIVAGGRVLTVVRPTPPAEPQKYLKFDQLLEGADGKKRVVAVATRTGKQVWRVDCPRIVPLSLAARGDRAFFHDGTAIVCVDLKSGAEHWRSSPDTIPERLRAWHAPTLVAHDDVVLFACHRTLTALSTATGETLWTAPCPSTGYYVPIDVFVIDGKVWTPDVENMQLVARDLTTGEVSYEQQYTPSVKFPHHRCYRMKASGRNIVASWAGVELLDTRTGGLSEHHWVRGSCYGGVLPANGLIYQPPHHCACYMQAKLLGFNALAARKAESGERRAESQKSGEQRAESLEPEFGDPVEYGPAYDEITPSPSPSGSQLSALDSRLSGSPLSALDSQLADWPTYRHNASRNAVTSTKLPKQLGQKWATLVKGRLSPPVVAAGRVFVASTDAHTVHALDAETGQEQWQYFAGARVDSPPTYFEGSVLFGSADGWVYCLRAADGELVWRRRAAPTERLIFSRGQLESAWPVSGSVLVVDGIVYCTAGRSSYLDGGLRLLRLDARTGQLLSETPIYSRDETTGRQPVWNCREEEMPGVRQDILSYDGKYVYLQHVKFDLDGVQLPGGHPHLFSPTGFLDNTWWPRSHWVFGNEFQVRKTGASEWDRNRLRIPSGWFLVCDEQTIYGYGDNWDQNFDPENEEIAPSYRIGHMRRDFRLFAANKTPRPAANAAAEKENKPSQTRTSDELRVDYRWTQQIPVKPWAMALAGDTLVLAGQGYAVPDGAADGTPTQKTNALWTVEASTGAKKSEYLLPTFPVWDGMALAQQRVYLSTISGHVLCLGETAPGPLQPLISSKSSAGRH